MSDVLKARVRDGGEDLQGIKDLAYKYSDNPVVVELCRSIESIKVLDIVGFICGNLSLIFSAIFFLGGCSPHRALLFVELSGGQLWRP